MRIGIVGGGIAGLAVAEALGRRGLEPLVFEAAARAGGRIATETVDGFLLETGPNGFLDKAPHTLELIERLGLGASLRRADPVAGRRWLWLRGALREVPTTPPAFLRSDILPLHAKLRLLLEPLTRRSRAADESIASFGNRHLGKRASRDLLGGMVLGIFAGKAEELSLRSCFPRMAALEAEHRSLFLAMLRRRRQRQGGGPAGPGGTLSSLAGGLGTLPAALASHLGPALRLQTRVEEVRAEGEGFRLRIRSPQGAEELGVDALVLATPVPESARLLRPLEAAAAEEMEAVPRAPMAVVHLAWPRERIAHPLDGFGFLIPPHEKRDILGAIFVSSVFPWRAPAGQALFTVMVGGSVRPELVEHSEEALVSRARAELERIVGASGRPSLARVVRWREAIPQYRVGHGERVAGIEARLARWPRLFLAGDAWHGVGINDTIAHAQRVAERIATLTR